jgi:putative endonuclease
MIFQVYILYSANTNSYYIGQTVDLENRIDQHNTHVFLKSETRKATDWELYFKIECKTRAQAIQIERHIKRMKSKRYIQNLHNYPEIADNLLKRYS